MSKKENKAILPVADTKGFTVGEEICDLGLYHRTKDCNFEVLDPKEGAIRSLMTGEDTIVESGYFIRLSEMKNLPDTSDLTDAQKGEFYRNLLDGHTFQVVESEDDHLVRLLNVDTAQLSLNARTANNYFYKIDKDNTGSPPIDNDGQFLLFEL
ncbi:MAG: hypothetical protein NE334_17160 [Lentisphaeraceae bacterium]|nr:hypothetical protein [Lentisphaeraceae bacterium]